MKPIVQQIPPPENASFVAQTVHTSYFEIGWHQHAEYELILFTEGSGLACIGDQERKFEAGDIFFLGSNLPHTFQKDDLEITAVIVQFRDDCWGKDFMNMPECWHIKKLLEMSGYGLMFTGNSKCRLHPLIKDLETVTDVNRIIFLLQCLQIMTIEKEYVRITEEAIQEWNQKDKECIERIFKFTNDSFQNSISLSQVAAIACMSVQSFCHYFKLRTQKTYIDFLNEVRMAYACRQLLETDKTVTDVCYDSGYNTVAYFHRQFLKLKKLTPLQYRKTFATGIIGNERAIANNEEKRVAC